MATIKTTFWDDNPFGAEVDEKLSKYQTDLSNIESSISWVDTNMWMKQSNLIKEQNKQLEKDIAKYQSDYDSVNQEYRANTEQRRKQSDAIVSERNKAAWLQANIAAAAAPEAWRLSMSQLQSINQDITNQFSASIAEAMKDNVNFQTSLDDKLATFWFSTIDKKKILSELSKSLREEETAPLLDSLATVAQNKKDFINSVWNVIKTINEQKITEATNRWLRSDRVESEERVWNLMTWPQRERYIRDQFSATWNVLSPWQQNELIQKSVAWTISLSEIDNIIKNMKDKAEQSKVIQATATPLDKSLAEQTLLETWIQEYNIPTFTKWTPSNQGNQNNNQNIYQWDIPWVNAPAVVNKWYTVGWVTFLNKKAYDTVKSYATQLQALQKSDPVRFKEVSKVIKDKFILK